MFKSSFSGDSVRASKAPSSRQPAMQSRGRRAAANEEDADLDVTPFDDSHRKKSLLKFEFIVPLFQSQTSVPRFLVPQTRCICHIHSYRLISFSCGMELSPFLDPVMIA